MSRFARCAALLVLVLSSTACYHATVETGATPSAVTVRKGFAHGWIYGLVPPSTVETASKCTNGVARVETQLSFVNQLVSFFTWGIYTPMEVEVTCAAGRTTTSSSGPTAGAATGAVGPGSAATDGTEGAPRAQPDHR